MEISIPTTFTVQKQVKDGEIIITLKYKSSTTKQLFENCILPENEMDHTAYTEVMNIIFKEETRFARIKDICVLVRNLDDKIAWRENELHCRPLTAEERSRHERILDQDKKQRHNLMAERTKLQSSKPKQ